MIKINCCWHGLRWWYDLIKILIILFISVSDSTAKTDEKDCSNKNSCANCNQNGSKRYDCWWAIFWVTKFVGQWILAVFGSIVILTAKWWACTVTFYSWYSGTVLSIRITNYLWALIELIISTWIKDHLTITFIWDIKFFHNQTIYTITICIFY